MHLRRLWLTDFRNHASADVSFAPGLTAVVGDNGQGKSNLLEAVAYLATLSSFRGAPTEALVRSGSTSAVVRAELERDGREVLIEAELVPSGRSRVQVNRQRLARNRDLLGALRVSVFAPDDLALVKAGPAGRRRFLDDTLVALSTKNDELQSEVERVLRQRGALLKQAGGRLSPEVALTLDVWDEKLAVAGSRLGERRVQLLADLRPYLQAAYADLAGTATTVTAEYLSAWWGSEAGLAGALAAAREEDLRRRLTTIGPHRDEVAFGIGGLPARTHASQGEQRSLALALRLAAHRLVADATNTPPVLLLDDVFSELDPARAEALVTHLLAAGAQTIVTTAGALPPSAHPESVLRVVAGAIN